MTGGESSRSGKWKNKKRESECVGCINFPFISMSSTLEMLSQFQMPKERQALRADTKLRKLVLEFRQLLHL